MRGKWIPYSIVMFILCLIAALLVAESLNQPIDAVNLTNTPNKVKAPLKEQPGTAIIDQELVMNGMFPEKDLQLSQGLFKAGEREHYYIESIRPGSYTGSDKDELLVVVRRPIDEPSHNEGFYQAYMAVFDNKTGKRVSSVQNFSSDEGDYGLFEYKGRHLIFFAGNKTYQGWTEWDAGLWEAGSSWKKLWPLEDDYWKDKAIQIHDVGFDLYMRRILVPASEERVIPEYTWEFSKHYYWNSDAGRFIEQ